MTLIVLVTFLSKEGLKALLIGASLVVTPVISFRIILLIKHIIRDYLITQILSTRLIILFLCHSQMVANVILCFP